MAPSFGTSTSLGGIRAARPGVKNVVVETMEVEPPSEILIPFPRTTLRRWNAAMFAFHTILATTTLALGNPDLSVPLYRTSLSFEVRLNGTFVAVTPETRPDDIDAFRLQPYLEERGALLLVPCTAAFFLLSAVFHLLNATIAWSFYVRMLERCYTPTRWIEYTLSAPLMFVLIAYGIGLRGRGEFLATTALIATTMFFGAWVEREARPASLTRWTRPFAHRVSPWILGHLPQVAAWLVVILQFYDNGWESDRVPWFVHVILWGELVLFFSFGAASLLSQWNEPRYFYRGEVWFQVLSLVSKGLLGILLLTNILMLQRFEEIYESELPR